MRRPLHRNGPLLGILAVPVIAAFVYGAYFYGVPKKVAGMTVQARTVSFELTGPALLGARNKVTVTARIQGFLKTVTADKNDTVTSGQVLAQIDSEDLESQLAVAQADAKAAQLAVAEARNAQEGTRAQAAKAKEEYDRKRPLLPAGTISQSDWLTVETAYKQTQADLAGTAITIDRLQAKAASADANVRLLQVRLNEATIRSPLDGVVVTKTRNVGDLLSPGAPLLEIVDPHSVILTARFDESVMGTISPGQRVTANFTAASLKPVNGSVLRLIRQVDEETREFEVDIVLDHLPEVWALGQRATVVIEADSPRPAITVPEVMLVRRRGRVGIWKVEDGRAQWVPVNLGYPSGSSVEVVSGLQPGDVVVRPKGVYAFQPIELVEQQSLAGAESPQ